MASPIESSIVAGSRRSRLHPLAIARREAAQKQFCRQLVDTAVCDTVVEKVVVRNDGDKHGRAN